MMDGMLVYGEEYIEKMYEKYPKHIEIIQTLIMPSEITFQQAYHKRLYELAINYSKEGLRQLRDDYFWMYNTYKYTEPLTEEYFDNCISQRTYPFFKDYYNGVTFYPIMSPSNINVHIEYLLNGKIIKSKSWSLKSPGNKSLNINNYYK